jgi:hypothetical protein
MTTAWPDPTCAHAGEGAPCVPSMRFARGEVAILAQERRLLEDER